MISLNQKPQLKSSVVFEEESGKFYLYDSETNYSAILDNEVAVEIVNLCDGNRAIQNIAEEIAKLYDLKSLNAVLRDVIDMITVLADDFLTVS